MLRANHDQGRTTGPTLQVRVCAGREAVVVEFGRRAGWTILCQRSCESLGMSTGPSGGAIEFDKGCIGSSV